MTSEEFSMETANLVRRISSRIQGVGHQQYDMGGSQKFEQMPLEEISEELLAEIEDGIAYLAMLHIRIRTGLARAVEGR